VPALLKLLGEFDDKGELAHDLDLYRRPKGIIKLSGDAKKNPIRPDDIVWTSITTTKLGVDKLLLQLVTNPLQYLSQLIKLTFVSTFPLGTDLWANLYVSWRRRRCL
jgi:hypothetical protein